MTTIAPLPPPTTPVRGTVTRTWSESRVLTGFLDDAGVQSVLGEYLASLDDSEKAMLMASVQASQAARLLLPSIDFNDVIVSYLTGPETVAIEADPLYKASFGAKSPRFAKVRADKLVAIQLHVNPRNDLVPTDETALTNYCLPNRWDVPAEISFMPPTGPIYITSSAPTLSGVQIEMDNASGRVMLSPPKHINLVQVLEFNGRYYLRNGYHRIYDLLKSGIRDIPALVITTQAQTDVDLGGLAFSSAYIVNLPRPPLVADFLTSTSIETKVRVRRYGISLSLDMKPFNIGI